LKPLPRVEEGKVEDKTGENTSCRNVRRVSERREIFFTLEKSQEEAARQKAVVGFDDA